MTCSWAGMFHRCTTLIRAKKSSTAINAFKFKWQSDQGLCEILTLYHCAGQLKEFHTQEAFYKMIAHVLIPFWTRLETKSCLWTVSSNLLQMRSLYGEAPGRRERDTSLRFPSSTEKYVNYSHSLNQISQNGSSSLRLYSVVQCSKGNATCLQQMANYHWDTDRLYRRCLLIPASGSNSGAASQSKVLFLFFCYNQKLNII